MKQPEQNIDPIQEIFENWNSKRQTGKWKVHRELSYEMRYIITKRLKQYSVQDLKAAIDNYAFIVQSDDYKMSYLWTLYQFLSRRRPDRIAENELQLYRFLPNSFSKYDFQLTDEAKIRLRSRQKEAVRQQQAAESVPEIDRGEALRKLAESGNGFAQRLLERRMRQK